MHYFKRRQQLNMVFRFKIALVTVFELRSIYGMVRQGAGHSVTDFNYMQLEHKDV